MIKMINEMMQSLTAPHNKYIAQIDWRLRSVLLIPFNKFLFTYTLKVIHSCDNHD